MQTLSLKNQVIRASAWTFLGHGLAQAIRFGGNLILTRLLFPEAFGLMALVNTIMQGLYMFSDLGIAPSIVQNPRGEQPEFLRTAWTWGILRGFGLWMIAAALSWPMAVFYEEPALLALLPIAAAVVVINGFSSTNLYTLARRLDVGRLTAIDVVAQVAGLLLMAGWAWYWRSVWTLVLGGIFGALVKCFLTFAVIDGPKMRFEFHREIARDILRFGRWIFISSILGFLVTRLDRLVLGRFMEGMGQFGVYSIAVTFSQMMVEVIAQLSNKILFPVYARLAEQDMDRLRRQTIRVRRILLAITLPPVWVLVIWGPELIQFLYDDRYLEAGWMLQILGVAAVFQVVFTPVDCVLLAVGDSYRFMLLQMARTAILLAAMLVGRELNGVPGILQGLVVASFLYYPFLAALVSKYKAWLPRLDLWAVLISAFAILLGLLAKGY